MQYVVDVGGVLFEATAVYLVNIRLIDVGFVVRPVAFFVVLSDVPQDAAEIVVLALHELFVDGDSVVSFVNFHPVEKFEFLCPCKFAHCGCTCLRRITTFRNKFEKIERTSRFMSISRGSGGPDIV